MECIILKPDNPTEFYNMDHMHNQGRIQQGARTRAPPPPAVTPSMGIFYM